MFEDLDDSELVRTYLAGESRAFDEIVRRHVRSLYSFVYRLTGGNGPMAEDVVQEAFVKAWKHIRRFNVGKSFRTWLFTIAKNTAVDSARRRREVPFAFFRNDEGRNVLEETVTTNDDSLGEALDRADTAAIVWSALDQLPESQRMILVMHYREDFSLLEIAEIFGVSYNTVKSRHTRGIQYLKKAIFKSTASKSS